MKIRIVLQVVPLASLMIVAGCATANPGADSNSRVGAIHAFYSTEKLRADPPSCLASLTPEQIAAGQYVEIKVTHGRRNEYLSAWVPTSIQVKLRDEVEFAPKFCEHGVVPEVKQILKRHE